MKNIKKMLLGIALLIISVIGALICLLNAIIGVIVFFASLAVGFFFVIDGFLSVDE